MTADDVIRMVAHWLSTPKNAYWGQNYGQDLKRELLKSTNTFNADRLLAEMKKDIPLLANLSNNELDVVVLHGVDEYGTPIGEFDTVQVFVRIFGALLPISET